MRCFIMHDGDQSKYFYSDWHKQAFHSALPLTTVDAFLVNACVSSIVYLVSAGPKRQSRTSILESCRLKRSALGRRMHDIEKNGGGGKNGFMYRWWGGGGIIGRLAGS